MTLLETARHARDTVNPQLLADAVPFARLIGLRLELRGDELIGVMPANRRLLGNPVLESLHGGATAGILECVASLALLWRAPLHVVPRPLEFTVDFLTSGKLEPVHAHARILKLGRRVANVHVEAWQSDRSRPIGAGHGNYLLT